MGSQNQCIKNDILIKKKKRYATTKNDNDDNKVVYSIKLFEITYNANRNKQIEIYMYSFSNFI